ncbi:hypothetical protein [Streptomyces sparsogenes]|uniref:Uncharacterized protein n=1 Tax=Streptomyces sparsogenes DSM 40356 TaxID=1331668 RepID=A0A1R1SS87_9ACTN|nr:hypothetical protein [Streptomyces sparsogenes]OMI40909.1 hypothetical protein SPAR_03596 [Streptomyces sparsogenes DSM 40356]
MSGGNNPDLKLDKAALQDITKGLRAAISELKDIGTATDAVMGAGFEELSLTSMEAGHNGLAKDFEDFCERWEWGVRGLIQDANKLAQKVGLAAGMQWEEDRYIEGTYKVVANSLTGNPHLSEEEVTQKKWGEIYSAWRPDYSQESYDKASEEIKATWQETGDGMSRTSNIAKYAVPPGEQGDGQDGGAG